MKQTRIIHAASAAIFKQDQVLLVLRAKDQYKEHWSLPGGHIEETETVEQAAQREVLEETNISCKIFSQVQKFKVIADDQTHYHLHVFWGKWISGHIHASSDASAATWILPSVIPTLLTTPGLYEIVSKAEKLYNQSP